MKAREEEGFLRGIRILDLANETPGFRSRVLPNPGIILITMEKPVGDASRSADPSVNLFLMVFHAYAGICVAQRSIPQWKATGCNGEGCSRADRTVRLSSVLTAIPPYPRKPCEARDRELSLL